MTIVVWTYDTKNFLQKVIHLFIYHHSFSGQFSYMLHLSGHFHASHICNFEYSYSQSY